MVEFNVSSKFSTKNNQIWVNFINSLPESSFEIDGWIDTVLEQYSGGDIYGSSTSVQFETKEDMLIFILKFS